MKKPIVLFISLCLVVFLTACGNNTNNSQKEDSIVKQDSVIGLQKITSISAYPNDCVIQIGEKKGITVTIQPSSIGTDTNFMWTTSDSSVATVFGDGMGTTGNITGIGIGQCTVTVIETKSNISTKINVNVKSNSTASNTELSDNSYMQSQTSSPQAESSVNNNNTSSDFALYSADTREWAENMVGKQLTYSDVSNLNQEQLDLLINTIYMHNNYKFEAGHKWDNYFRTMYGYVGEYSMDETGQNMSEFDKNNVDIIVKARG